MSGQIRPIRPDELALLHFVATLNRWRPAAEIGAFSGYRTTGYHCASRALRWLHERGLVGKRLLEPDQRPANGRAKFVYGISAEGLRWLRRHTEGES